MILNRKIYSRRKSINRLDRKSNNNRVRQHRQSKKNQKGGNYFLGLDQPRIGGLSVVSYQDDLYAQAGPNVNIAYTDINLKNMNNINLYSKVVYGLYKPVNFSNQPFK